MTSISFGALFELPPFDKFNKNSNQNLEMSCDVSKSLLCKNIFHSLHILSSTPNFQIWSSGQFCTIAYLNISLKPPPKLWDVSGSMQSNFMQKPSDVLWKKLSESTSFSFWSSLVFSTATLVIFALVTLCFHLLVVNPTKRLSLGACTHWDIFGSCNDAIYPLSRIEVLQNLH